MKAISDKDLIRVLEKNGWSILRVTGSHNIYGKSGSIIRLSVPVHGNRPLKTGLLHHLFKTAGLTERDIP